MKNGGPGKQQMFRAGSCEVVFTSLIMKKSMGFRDSVTSLLVSAWKLITPANLRAACIRDSIV